MAAKKAAKKRTSESGLTRQESGVVAYREFFSTGLKRLAETMSATLAPAQLGSVMKDVRLYKTTIENMEKLAKASIVKLLKEKGARVEDTKGKLALEVNGVTLTMSPYRTGTDASKLEKLLRAKGADVNLYMRPTVSYAVDEDRTKLALDNGTLTPDELATCNYDESWTVQTPLEKP